MHGERRCGGGGGGLRARGEGTPTKEGEGDSRAFQGFFDWGLQSVLQVLWYPIGYYAGQKNPQELHVAQELVPL